MSATSSACSRPWSCLETLRTAAPGRMDAEGVRMRAGRCRELRARAEHVFVRHEQVRASDELVHGGVPERAMCPEVLARGRKSSPRHPRARELGPQLGVLRGDAHRARVLVALAHHDAAHGQSGAVLSPTPRRRAASPRGGRARFELAVRLQNRASAQVVGDERLLRLGEAELPGQTRALDAGPADAPVPPSCPLISTWSALPFTTPAAMVPTPFSTPASRDARRGVAFLQSWMSCARSSME